MSATADPVELLREVVDFAGVHRPAGGCHPLWSRVFAVIDDPPESVDALVEKLDARCAETGERWDVHRTAAGEWVAHACDRHLSGRDDPAALSVRRPTMTTALADLLATPRLPVIPRRPEPAVYLTVEKRDGWWEVRHNGMFAGYRARTKREAIEAKERGEVSARARYEDWVTTWATIVDAGEEGVDFYWKS